jgi:hypothetical protein
MTAKVAPAIRTKVRASPSERCPGDIGVVEITT